MRGIQTRLLITMFSSTLVSSFSAAATIIFPLGLAQAPPTPTGLTVIDSAIFKDASVSFKETHICETTDGVKGYSGYVNLPAAPNQGRHYPVHTWFW